MSTLLPRSLQGRLLVLVLGGACLVWLLAALLTWQRARHELDELLDGHLAQAAALLVAQQADADDEERSADVPLLHRYAPRVAFQVWHGDQLTLHSGNAGMQPLSPVRAGFATVDIGGRRWRVFAAAGHKGDVQVFVGERLEARGEILAAVMESMLVPLLLALPLFALLGVGATRQAMQPLKDLQHSLAQREPRALGPLDLPTTATELQGMVGALNGLFARIAQLLDGERRFTADAAHELRTPIAAIRAQAQVALASADDAERRHALQATMEGCDRAARLMEQLLTLSRLEADAAPAARQVDLVALCRTVVAQVAPQALQKQQALQFDGPSTCPAAVDEALFSALVRNLVDNAVRYTPAGGQVQISLQAGDGAWLLRVEDSGPGMDDAQRARLGERFFRVLGNDAAGSGLGWSIVQRIAQVLLLQVDTHRSALGGLQVTVKPA